MVRSVEVFLLGSLLMSLLAGCGASPSANKTQQAVLKVEVNDSIPESSSPAIGEKAPLTPEEQSQYLEMISAATVFKKILDAKPEGKKPYRMQGQVITNATPKLPFFDSTTKSWFVGENILFDFISQNTGVAEKSFTPQESAFALIKQQAQLSERKLTYDLRMRLVSTGTDNDTLKALDIITKTPKEYNKAVFPITILLSKNFYDEKAPSVQRDFSAIMKIEKGHFDGFFLLDSKQTLVGHVSLPFYKESSNIQKQKMIVYFKDTYLKQNIEQLGILQMTEINFINKIDEK